MSEYKDEIYLLIILGLVILTALTPVIKAEINSKEECINEGSITMCREVYTCVTRDWHIKERRLEKGKGRIQVESEKKDVLNWRGDISDDLQP